MNDLISRQQAIDAINEYMVGKRCDTDGTMMARLINELVINKLPSAQPEIIRCRNCRYYNSEEKECLDLLGHGRRWEEDDFCSYGVKMEEVTS